MEQIKSRIGQTLALALMLSMHVLAQAGSSHKVELNDAQLERIVAGAVSVVGTDDLANFTASKTTRGGLEINASGSIQLADSIDRAMLGSLVLSDQAQGNLRSMVNINAVNSVVNVLMNLNININSTVGSLNQFNLTGALPLGPVRAGP